MSNTDIWDKISRPDPKVLKAFQRSGGFRGTAINPMHTLRTVTEVFGPCGKGWAMTKPDFQVIGTNVYCTVGVTYLGAEQPVWGVGGETLSGRGDDEAFKKAYTDALGNALKHLGANADIYFNLWDGNKYVDEKPEPVAQPRKAKTLSVETEIYQADPDTSDLTGTPGAPGNKNARELFSQLTREMEQAKTVEGLKEWLALRRADVDTLPEKWMADFKDAYFLRKDHLAGVAV